MGRIYRCNITDEPRDSLVIIIPFSLQRLLVFRRVVDIIIRLRLHTWRTGHEKKSGHVQHDVHVPLSKIFNRSVIYNVQTYLPKPFSSFLILPSRDFIWRVIFRDNIQGCTDTGIGYLLKQGISIGIISTYIKPNSQMLNVRTCKQT